jgi:hypothetical protein
MRVLPWSVCSAVTFLALLGGVWTMLPAYNGQFALRGPLRAQEREAAGTPLHVVCYPQRFDSVRFYLPDAVTEVYTSQERGLLRRRLESGGETLLVVRSGRSLAEVLDELPASAEFVPCQSGGAFTVGWVRPRADGREVRVGGNRVRAAPRRIERPRA